MRDAPYKQNMASATWWLDGAALSSAEAWADATRATGQEWQFAPELPSRPIIFPNAGLREHGTSGAVSKLPNGVIRAPIEISAARL